MTATARLYRVLWVMGLLAACAPEQEVPAEASASQQLQVGQAHLVLDIADTDNGVSRCTTIGSTCFFTLRGAAGGWELWKSDGTQAGTVRLRDLASGSDGSGPSALIPVDGTLFFIASGTTGGRALWKSDGTEAGTVRLRDIAPDSNGFGPSALTPVDGTLFFIASGTTGGRALWKSDGTEAGTVRLRDFFPDPRGSEIRELTSAGGVLYFVTHLDGGGYNPGTWELWKSDGTEAGTLRLRDFSPQGVGSLQPTAGGVLVFSVRGCLWRSNGTPEGTVPVGNHCPGSAYLRTRIGNTAFFHIAAGHGVSNSLWRSDGTEEGTGFLSWAGEYGGHFTPEANFAVVGSTLYFRGPANSLGKSDGTPAGTVIVRYWKNYMPHNLVAAGDMLFFVADGEVWASDGTLAGTTQVTGTTQVSDRGMLSQHCCSGMVAGGRFFFGWDDDELWSSDGTVAGTMPVVDLPVEWLIGTVGDLLYFTARHEKVGTALFVMDATKVSRGHAPVAQAAEVVTDEDVPVSILLSGSDEDGGTLSFSVTQPPEYGKLSGTPPSLTYTPVPHFYGTERLRFQVSDFVGHTSEAEVTITVVPRRWRCSSGSSAPLVWLLPVMAAWALRRRSSRRPE